MSDTVVFWLIATVLAVGFVFLVLAVIGIHLWQRGRMAIFTSQRDMLLTCGSPVVALFMVGVVRGLFSPEYAIAAVVVLLSWGLLLLVAAWRTNDERWKVWFALPARILAMALVCVAIVLAREGLSRFWKKASQAR